MQQIGIIGAMEPEVALLRQQINDVSCTELGGYSFYSGKLAGSRQDDLCLTLQLTAYWATRFAAQSIPGVDFALFN